MSISVLFFVLFLSSQRRHVKGRTGVKNSLIDLSRYSVTIVTVFHLKTSVLKLHILTIVDVKTVFTFTAI